MATIPVSNTYARALAPSINVPVSPLSDMPAHVGLLQGSIPQITPTQGMLDFTPISIDESKWNLPSSSPSFNVGDYVKNYFKKINNPDPPPPPINSGNARSGLEIHDRYYPGHRKLAKEAGAAGIMAYINGTHSKWQNKIKQEMVDLEILDNTDQKYDSGKWKEWLQKRKY